MQQGADIVYRVERRRQGRDKLTRRHRRQPVVLWRSGAAQRWSSSSHL